MLDKFPIGGTLADVAAPPAGLAVLWTGRRPGWRRSTPLAHALVILLAVNLPVFLFNQGDPGIVAELVMGAGWLFVALAVYVTGDAVIRSRRPGVVSTP